MKNLFKVFVCSMAVLAMGALTGCHNGDVYIYDSADAINGPSISINNSTASLAKSGEDIPVEITANSVWKVECSETWAVPMPSEGEGNATVSIKVSDNNGSTMRRATVTFTVYQKSTGWKWDKAELKIMQSATDEVYVEGDIEKLIAFIKSKHAGVSTNKGSATLAYPEDELTAVILANYGDGNNSTSLCVGDNTGYPDSAIKLYDSNWRANSNSSYPQGSVVKISGLKTATFINRYGVRQLEGVKVTRGEGSEELVIPELTIADLLTDQFQSQYVAVKDVKAAAEWDTKPWSIANNADENNREQEVTVGDSAGGTLNLYMTKYSTAFVKFTINASKTGTIKVVPSRYNSTIQASPLWTGDVLELSNVALLLSKNTAILNAEVGATDEITIQAQHGWTATTTGAGFTVSATSGEGNDDVLTITADAVSATELSTALGTVVLTSGGDKPEKQTITVRQRGTGSNTVEGLYDYIVVEEIAEGASVAGFASADQPFTAYVSAVNVISEADGKITDGGNYGGKVAICDNTGKLNSGIILYGIDDTHGLKIGQKVTVDFTNATYSPYNGLPELKGATVAAAAPEEIATLVVPELTVSEAKNSGRLGQYVCIKDVTPTADGAWAGSPATMKDASGATLATYVKGEASFGLIRYSKEQTGNLYGVMEMFSDYQLIPVSNKDIEAFKESTDPSVKIAADNLLFVNTEESKTIKLTIKNIADPYTVTTSTVDADNNQLDDHFVTSFDKTTGLLTVKALENTSSKAIEATMTIIVSFTNVEGNAATISPDKTVSLKQNAGVSAATELVLTREIIETALGSAIPTSAANKTWTTDEIGFYGYQIQTVNSALPPFKPYATSIAINSSTTASKKGYITNTTAMNDIQQIVVEVLSNSQNPLTVTLYVGNKPADDAAYDGVLAPVTKTAEPVKTELGAWRHTVTYSFAGYDYTYFKLVNETAAAFYTDKITISYNKE